MVSLICLTFLICHSSTTELPYRADYVCRVYFSHYSSPALHSEESYVPDVGGSACEPFRHCGLPSLALSLDT